ncbi:MAG TPA: ABC transporter substrate-binding protein [Candidatus Dormibacteraeota bacterium]|jgi:branched-chain amino acid transport system substrate-binding protein|nr:ABC transporter substrate-binding protein [Candidatus Dormibacteraeota bacterium]
MWNKRRSRWLMASAASALLLAACGTSNNTTSPTVLNGPLTFGSDSSFTGPNASFGLEQVAGCYTAVSLINKSGGMFGQQVQCQIIDNRNDPADGVAAATKAVATIQNFGGTLGPGGVATATEPVYESSNITMMADTGDSAFNKTTDKYFWRVTPPDSAGGFAMAVWALKQHYMKAAAVFSNDTTAQTSVPTLLSGYKKGGGNMAINLQVVPDQSSYQVEAARVLDAHPQVIFTEADPQTDATFFKAFKSLNGGQLIPIIGTAPTITADWAKAVGDAVGTSDLDKYYVGLQPYVTGAGKAWDVFNTALLADSAQIPNPSQWSSDAYSMTDYDGINIMALAMLDAHSWKPTDYNSHILNVTAPGSGKTDVFSFEEGKAALAAGKTIRYNGAGGAVNFDQWHNYGGDFSANGYDASGNQTTAGVVTAADVKKLSA